MRGRDTRQRLLDAATEAILGKGYHATGVGELCRLAQARKGSFYHFFPTKTDLALAAISHIWDTTRRDVFDAIDGSGAAGLDRVRRLVEAVDTIQRRQWAERQALGSPIGRLGQETAGEDRRLRAAIGDVFGSQCAYVRRWLDEAVAARQIGPGDNLRRSRDILALIEGALLMSRVAGDPSVFGEICASVPALAGRLAAPSRPSPATAPELA